VRTLLGVPTVAKSGSGAESEAADAVTGKHQPVRIEDMVEVDITDPVDPDERPTTLFEDTRPTRMFEGDRPTQPLDIEIDLDALPPDEVTFVDDVHVRAVPALSGQTPETDPASLDAAFGDLRESPASRNTLREHSSAHEALAAPVVPRVGAHGADEPHTAEVTAPEPSSARIQQAAAAAAAAQSSELGGGGRSREAREAIERAVAATQNDIAARRAPISAFPAGNFSSLAPREVARTEPAAPQDKRERSAAVGALSVAAVMFLAAGAWWFTSGTFQRGSTTRPSGAEEAPMAVARPVSNLSDPVTKPAEPAVTPEGMQAQPPAATPENSADNAQQPQNAVASSDAKPNPNVPSHLPPALGDGAGKPKPGTKGHGGGLRVSHAPRGKAAPAPAPSENGLPAGPSRTDVLQRLESVRPSVRACAAGRSGVADLDITIAHTGSVMHVLVGGDFAGTTEGSCIARAVRQARFPTFSQERFRLLFPYAI
jgi:hypothetical protein